MRQGREDPACGAYPSDHVNDSGTKETQPIAYATAHAATLANDRRGWLIGFGIVNICLGVLWLAWAGFGVVLLMFCGWWGCGLSFMMQRSRSGWFCWFSHLASSWVVWVFCCWSSESILS